MVKTLALSSVKRSPLRRMRVKRSINVRGWLACGTRLLFECKWDFSENLHTWCFGKVYMVLVQACIFFLRNGKVIKLLFSVVGNLVLSRGTFFGGIQWLACISECTLCFPFIGYFKFWKHTDLVVTVLRAYDGYSIDSIMWFFIWFFLWKETNFPPLIVIYCVYFCSSKFSVEFLLQHFS